LAENLLLVGDFDWALIRALLDGLVWYGLEWYGYGTSICSTGIFQLGIGSNLPDHPFHPLHCTALGINEIQSRRAQQPRPFTASATRLMESCNPYFLP